MFSLPYSPDYWPLPSTWMSTNRLYLRRSYPSL